MNQCVCAVSAAFGTWTRDISRAISDPSARFHLTRRTIWLRLVGLGVRSLSTSINRISLLNNTFIPKGYIEREHTKESRKWLAIFYVVSIPTDDPFDRCLVQSYKEGKIPMISYSWHSSDWYNLPSDMALVLVWWWWMCNTHTRPEIDIGCSYSYAAKTANRVGCGLCDVSHMERKKNLSERGGYIWMDGNCLLQSKRYIDI